MKKISAITVLILLLLSLAGCTASSQPATDDKCEEYEAAITKQLGNEIPALLVYVSEDSGVYSLSVSVASSGKVSSFGNYVLAARSAFETVFAEELRKGFSVDMAIAGNNSSLIRFSSSNYAEMSSSLSGSLSDTRSGELKMTRISGLDDLLDAFPASKLYVDENGITK